MEIDNFHSFIDDDDNSAEKSGLTGDFSLRNSNLCDIHEYNALKAKAFVWTNTSHKFSNSISINDYSIS